MNQFIKYISDLEQMASLKEEELKEIKLKRKKEKENLKEQEKQEQDIKEEINDWTSIKYILENYKKTYWERIKSFVFSFWMNEFLAILLFVGESMLDGEPPINAASVFLSTVCALVFGIMLARKIVKSTKIIREIKKSYSLEEVIENIKEKEEELSKMNQKKEEQKKNLNQLNIQIFNLENELENIKIKRSQEISDYEWFVKQATRQDKIEMYTREIKELCGRRKNEIDFLINEEFERNHEKEETLRLKM